MESRALKKNSNFSPSLRNMAKITKSCLGFPRRWLRDAFARWQENRDFRWSGAVQMRGGSPNSERAPWISN
jgi:hypothetical protein